MKKIIAKITSRKFILTALTLTGSVALILKSDNNPKLQAVGFIVGGAATMMYNLCESKVDAAAAASKDVIEGVKMLNDSKEKE